MPVAHSSVIKVENVLAGHRKAVSYVRYLNNTELVSASTDSTLRLWDTKACTPARVFNGHNNEKNFVGLSVDADFIACGSETNEVSQTECVLVVEVSAIPRQSTFTCLICAPYF